MSLIVSIIVLPKLARLSLSFICYDGRVFLSSQPNLVLGLLFYWILGDFRLCRYLRRSRWSARAVVTVLFFSSLDEAFPRVSRYPCSRPGLVVCRIPNVDRATIKLLLARYQSRVRRPADICLAGGSGE
jgi:hypothetical protein